jgi:hypothetical protein
MDGGTSLLLPLKTTSNADCPSVMFCFADSRQARVNRSADGSDEQMFGSKQQVLHGGLVD